MQERPDPAIRKRRITRGRVIAATLSVGSAVALTAAIAVTDDAGASSPAQPRSSDRTSGNSSYANPGSNTPSYGGPAQADPFSGDDDGQYSGGDDNGFSAPPSAPDSSAPHTSSRGS